MIIIIIIIILILVILLLHFTKLPLTEKYTNTNIPKLLHLIWIGDREPPSTIKSWTENFAKANPDWTVKVWNNEDVKKLNLINKISYDKISSMCGKADIARYEILYRFGGIYIDADTIWLDMPLSNDLF